LGVIGRKGEKMSNLVVREKQARELINKQMKKIITLTGSKDKASKYASAILSIAMNKNLRDCTPESVIKTAVEIVELGLNPNPRLGLAYVVPYNIKKNGEIVGTTAQLQIGYKGWINLGYRNGWIFRAVAVYDVDKFNIRFNGLFDDVDFEPNYEERKEEDSNWVYKHLKGVLVFAMDSKKMAFSEFVPFKKLEKLRLKSPNQIAGKLSNVWAEWAEEMYKAKALKYVITRLPIADEMLEANSKEDEVYSEEFLTAIVDENEENEPDVNELLIKTAENQQELQLQAEKV
jgi:recombination protein RecT